MQVGCDVGWTAGSDAGHRDQTNERSPGRACGASSHPSIVPKWDIGPKGGSPHLKQQLGIKGDEHDAELLRDTRQAQSEIELLTGHPFEGERLALQVGSGGLPFVPTLSLQTATLEVPPEVWPIADPVQPEFSNVLQVARTQNPASHAVAKADALSAAGVVLAAVHRDGRLLLAPYVWWEEQVKTRPAVEFGRELMDQARFVHVPVATAEFEGWWVQLSRRIYFVTKDTPERTLADPAEGLTTLRTPPYHLRPTLWARRRSSYPGRSSPPSPRPLPPRTAGAPLCSGPRHQ